MTVTGVLQIVLFAGVLILVAWPLGEYMARVYAGEGFWMRRFLGPVERVCYRAAGIDPLREMDWKENTLAVLLLNGAGVLLLYALLRLQGGLPLNPQKFDGVPPDLSFNTAVSFVTNTNWQAYGGETTLSYLTQMMGLTVQNFLSAATGMAVAVLFIRGVVRHTTALLGNFWVDLVRTILYILLPLSIILSAALVGQGVVQTFAPSKSVHLIAPARAADGQVIEHQTLALGPVASQVATKHLGTNGGGYYNVNAAHPFENPTPLSDFLLVLAEGALAAALCVTFGRMANDMRQGWALLAAMMIIVVSFACVAYWAEAGGNPRMDSTVVDQVAGATNPGGNMEGKEVRFGVARSALFSVVTTATSCGAVNSMHDSFTPLGGLVQLVMMQLGEVALGGVGSGLYGMLVFVLASAFVAGLLVGRTPEYLGKKIESFEIKMISLLILIMPVLVLGATALAAVLPSAASSVLNPGAHGFSEILYAFTSQGNNNGSAFAGLNANTPFFNIAGAIAMLIARFWLIVPTLALAGSLARKKIAPSGAGTLPTHTPLFTVWLITVILLVGALNFLPVLALGPIVDHLQMVAK
jgi:potassium-transporting ATPase potassium-binding subunit